MSYDNDKNQSEYELGLEGEYVGNPPPGYESWAEWHYEHGDELPTDEDYGSSSDNEVIVESGTDEYEYDPDTDKYYCHRTHKWLTQRQLDAEADRETERINALADRIAAQNKRRAESRKSEWDENGMLIGHEGNQIRKPKKTIQELAAEQGVHPDMFTRTDGWCWKWIQNYNTWLYKRPRVYTIYKYTCFIIIGLCTIGFFIIMLFGL